MPRSTRATDPPPVVAHGSTLVVFCVALLHRKGPSSVPSKLQRVKEPWSCADRVCWQPPPATLEQVSAPAGPSHQSPEEGECHWGREEPPPRPGVGGGVDELRVGQEEAARTSGQNTSHPNTHKKTVPPGLRTRADITPRVTTTSREAFFGFEEGGRVFVSFR